MNITDVDDKIINNSNFEGVEYFEFARRWENDFFDDMKYSLFYAANLELRFPTTSPELLSMSLKLWHLFRRSSPTVMHMHQTDQFILILRHLDKNSNTVN